ncbi:uncharacterized protein PADG_05131 [Paracoccidioides brasiliensis Pb18]|uniref:Uncharacterized protein n=1 Tax=Paracoccidioides brasiliensis (strain Pb18) TaxID=502780 RepID=C1GCZ5_PARBD|nr:uncharacterized protein PADG_05131 [Paracoccidioides brasiliensis Pb18]EEH49052.1 hypothetical protein PADG_05131 [Paracoccidioides brasiliensis Pb18]ODH48466.1 hypothetical protein GX48_05443 [Paracoccidioides brasiliensis]
MTNRRFAAPAPREGSAWTWIAEHYSQPESYEIPLRTMYALNSTVGAHPPFSPLPKSPGATSPFEGNAFPSARNPRRKEEKPPAYNMSSTAAIFKMHLMSQISQLPSQPCSLPPNFITSFVRRCFPDNLALVDFPQALTALDYLRDLEQRRGKEIKAALEKLGIFDGVFDKDDLAKRYPGVSSWIDSIMEKDTYAAALYSQVYLRLRHWTLINELLLPPFNKAHCVAMLNTLFPAVISIRPAAHVCERMLMEERHTFFQYICKVEEKGPRVLDPLIAKDRRPGETTGWPLVHEYINKYMHAATDIINECFEVNNRESLEEQSGHRKQKKGRKVDSGISFGSNSEHPRPSTSSNSSCNHSYNNSNSSNNNNNPGVLNKPLPPSPAIKLPKSIKVSGNSALERIGRELRKMHSRGDFDEEKPKPPRTSSRAGGALRKMRSSSILGERDRNVVTGPGESEGEFDVVEFRRKRMIWEAKHNAAKADPDGDADAHANENKNKRSSA